MAIAVILIFWTAQFTTVTISRLVRMPDIQTEISRKVVPLTQHLLDARMSQRANTAPAEFVAALLPFFLRLAAGIVLVSLPHHLGAERPRSIRDGGEVEEPDQVMNWVKRNLYFLIGSVLALVLMGAAGWYAFQKNKLNNEKKEKLNEAYTELKRLKEQKPHPGDGKNFPMR